MKGTILPTHTCFDDALEFISIRMKDNPRVASRLFLVHAICIIPEGREAGDLFAHAWVEEVLPLAEVVWQDGFLNGQRITYSATKESVYEELKPSRVYRYNLRQAAQMNHKFQTFGPWVAELQALCRKKKRTG